MTTGCPDCEAFSTCKVLPCRLLSVLFHVKLTELETEEQLADIVQSFFGDSVTIAHVTHNFVPSEIFFLTRHVMGQDKSSLDQRKRFAVLFVRFCTYRGSKIGLLGCGMRVKMEVGCEVTEILIAGCGMKIGRRDRVMLGFVGGIGDRTSIGGIIS